MARLMYNVRMTYRMFYKQFLKIIDILDKSFVEEFDFWLATLPERIAKTISVSTVASRFEVKYSAANAIINFAEQIKLRHIQTSLIVQFALMSIRTRFLM